jgi:phage shock protein C
MFCPQCGNQSAPESSFCSSCGAAISNAAAARSRLVRPLHPRMLAGVCSGIAIHFGWDIALVRILFVVIACLTTGCAALFYFAGWILIPEAYYAVPPAPRYVAPQDMSQNNPA